ncbi:hypothetical protein IKS86_01930 [bacterium]|nr:hypothetical protein [bacterium]
MKKIIFSVLSLILLVVFVSCEDSTLPDLPDMEESMDVDAFEISDEKTADDSDQTHANDSGEPADDGNETNLPDDNPTENPDETPDEEEPEPVIKSAHLLVATVGGYDVPMSGHVYYAENESLTDGLKEIPVEGGMGSDDGADLNVAAFADGFTVIGRHDSSSLYFFDDNFEFEQEIKVKPDTYINMQDMVFNPFKNEFIVSALNSDAFDSKTTFSNKIFIFKKNSPETAATLEISDNESASPAKMKVVGKKLFVALQNLENNTSAKGEIAVVDLEDYSVERITLPTTNPTGKIEYNKNVDKNHIYLTTTGNWKQGDGALLQVNIDTYEVKKVLSESEEENNILDGDFVDLSIADNGNFFIIFSNNILYNDNSLLLYKPNEGKISKIDSGINAFAANPIDYSSVSGRVYYFVDEKSDTYLKALDSESYEEMKLLLDYGPAALRVKYDYK